MTKISKLPVLDEYNNDIYIPVVDLNENEVISQNKRINYNDLKGEKGEDGPKGDTGDTGQSAYELWTSLPGNELKSVDDFLSFIKGEDGIPGIDGIDGKSAYDIAVDDGFIGTEQEWLDSLYNPQFFLSDFSNVGDGVWKSTNSSNPEDIYVETAPEDDSKTYLLSGSSLTLPKDVTLLSKGITSERFINGNELQNNYKVLSVSILNVPDKFRIIIVFDNTNNILVSNEISNTLDPKEELDWMEVTLPFTVGNGNHYVVANPKGDHKVAIISGGNGKNINIAFSEDSGLTWSDKSFVENQLAVTSAWQDVEYANNLWIIVGSTKNTNATSLILKFNLNDYSWVTEIIPLGSSGCKITYKDNAFIIVGNDKWCTISLDNSQTWNKVNLPNSSPESFSKVTVSGSTNILALPKYTGKPLVSKDRGIIWNTNEFFLNGDYNWQATAVVGDTILSPQDNDNFALVSSDGGDNWTTISLPFNDKWTSSIVLNVVTEVGRFNVIILLGNKYIISTIDDGINWYNLTLPMYSPSTNPFIMNSSNGLNPSLSLMDKNYFGFKTIDLEYFTTISYFRDYRFKELVDNYSSTNADQPYSEYTNPFDIIPLSDINNTPNLNDLLIESFNDNIIIVNDTTGKVYYSFNNGGVWYNSQLPSDGELFGLRILNSDSNPCVTIMYLKDDQQSMYYSFDYGKTWNSSDLPDAGMWSPIAFRHSSVTGNNKVIVSSYNSPTIAIKSILDDEWDIIDVSEYTNNRVIREIFYIGTSVENYTGYYIAIGDNDILISTDYGQTWNNSDFNSLNKPIVQLDTFRRKKNYYADRIAFNYNGYLDGETLIGNGEFITIYLLVDNDESIGVLYSDDWGYTWKERVMSNIPINDKSLISLCSNSLWSEGNITDIEKLDLQYINDTSLILDYNSLVQVDNNVVNRKVITYIPANPNDEVQLYEIDDLSVIQSIDNGNVGITPIISTNGLFTYFKSTEIIGESYYYSLNGKDWFSKNEKSLNGVYFDFSDIIYDNRIVSGLVTLDDNNNPIYLLSLFKVNFNRGINFGFRNKIKNNNNYLYMRLS